MKNQREDAWICQELYEQSNPQSTSRKHVVITMSIENGVVQGEVLSVTIFLVAMATICKGIEGLTRILG
jgi:hypothetical protein